MLILALGIGTESDLDDILQGLFHVDSLERLDVPYELQNMKLTVSSQDESLILSPAGKERAETLLKQHDALAAGILCHQLLPRPRCDIYFGTH